MGYGDELMATAQARQVFDATGQETYFGEYTKVWKNNPCISPSGGFPVRNKTGDRPYVLGQTQDRVIFNPNFRAMPGEIWFSHNEIKKAKELIGKLKDYIVIEPHVKKTFSKGNKDWGWDKWLALVKDIDAPIVQMIQDKQQKVLPGAKKIEINEFRVACAIVKMAKLFIGTDGGLHHAAAAYGVVDKQIAFEPTRAVVIWGGFSHPLNLGYEGHVNIRANGSPPCGSKVECKHCKNMMKAVKVEHVLEAVKQCLTTSPPG